MVPFLDRDRRRRHEPKGVHKIGEAKFTVQFTRHHAPARQPRDRLLNFRVGELFHRLPFYPPIDRGMLWYHQFMFQGLEHTAIASPDPKRLAHWYVDHLGFRINFEYDGNFFVRAPNGSMLEIIPSQGGAVPTEMRTPGIRHLAIAVDDFDSSLAELRRLGVHFLGEPYSNQGNRLVFFADLDGNFLHLIERPQPLP